MGIDFWKRVAALMAGRTDQWLAGAIEVSKTTLSTWKSRGTLPDGWQCLQIAEALGVSVEHLVSGRPYVNSSGVVDLGDDFALATVASQKVSAGPGQELIEAEVTSTGTIPYPKKWGKNLVSIEAKGDSMTGIHLFGGDLVFYRPGEVDGDGIYVLAVNGTLLVKRVEFNHFDRKLTISSENPKYPARVEPADSQAVTLLGKVHGWMHQHVY